jgi:hypothetical protein
MTNRQLAFLHLVCARAILSQPKVYAVDKHLARCHIRDARNLRLGVTV